MPVGNTTRQIYYIANTQNVLIVPTISVHSTMYIILHRRHEPILVAHKTIKKSSTYVECVITFEGATNPTHNWYYTVSIPRY